MPSQPRTVHDRWEYTFPLPQLDIQQDFRTQQQYTLSRLTGIDGRYRGKLRRLPGFERMRSIAVNNKFSTVDGLVCIKPFAVQAGPTASSKVIRGIAYAAEDYGGTFDTIRLYYAEPPYSSWSLDAVISFSPNKLIDVDIAVDHQVLYVVGRTNTSPPTQVEYLLRYCGSTGNWQAAAWNTVPPQITAAPLGLKGSGQVSDDPFLQKSSLYGLAYRWIYPEQGFVGPLTYPPAVVNSGGIESNTGQHVFLRMTPSAPLSGNVFTSAVCQVFRTIDRGASEIMSAAGILFLEREIVAPRYTGTLGVDLSEVGCATFTTTSVTATIDVSGVSVGDVIYLHTYNLTGDTVNHAYNRNLHNCYFRRTVTNVDTPSKTITFSPSITPLPGFSSVVNRMSWYVSRAGDESDTRGTFVTPQIRWGWQPGTLDISPDAPIGLEDRSLIHQPSLDPEEFAVFQKGSPPSRFVVSYEDIFVHVTVASTETQSAELDSIRYSRADISRRGLLPVLNRKRIENLIDRIINLLPVGPFVVAILENSLIRFHRSGSRLAIDSIHNQHGAGGRNGAVAISSNLFMSSPVGVLICDVNSGQLDVVGATHHLFGESDRWGSDIAEIEAAYDAKLGCVVFLNPTKHEAILIWLNHSVITHLVDVPFQHVITSPDLVAGGKNRALFTLDSVQAGEAGSISFIDGLRSANVRATTGTLAGSNLALNGLAGSGTSSTALYPPAGKNFVSTMVGHFVRFFNPTTGESRGAAVRITDYVSPYLSFTGGNGQVGDRFAIGAIPIQITAWPLYGDPQTPILDLFSDKKVVAMGAALGNVTGDTAATNPNNVLRYQLFKRTGSEAAYTEGVIDATSTPQTYGKIAARHPILVPGIENWSSNLDMDILGLVVEGTIEKSKGT